MNTLNILQDIDKNIVLSGGVVTLDAKRA